MARRSPLARAPGALKRGGDTSEIANLVAFEGEKQIFEKTHNADKLKGGPLGIFKHPFCRKTSKN